MAFYSCDTLYFIDVIEHEGDKILPTAVHQSVKSYQLSESLSLILNIIKSPECFFLAY